MDLEPAQRFYMKHVEKQKLMSMWFFIFNDMPYFLFKHHVRSMGDLNGIKTIGKLVQ